MIAKLFNYLFVKLSVKVIISFYIWRCLIFNPALKSIARKEITRTEYFLVCFVRHLLFLFTFSSFRICMHAVFCHLFCKSLVLATILNVTFHRKVNANVMCETVIVTRKDCNPFIVFFCYFVCVNATWVFFTFGLPLERMKVLLL